MLEEEVSLESVGIKFSEFSELPAYTEKKFELIASLEWSEASNSERLTRGWHNEFAECKVNLLRGLHPSVLGSQENAPGLLLVACKPIQATCNTSADWKCRGKASPIHHDLVQSGLLPHAQMETGVQSLWLRRRHYGHQIQIVPCRRKHWAH